MRKCLLPDDGNGTVACQFDDGAWGMGFVLLAATPTDVVHRVEYLFRDVTIVLCRWFTTDVGACAYDGFLETEAQFFGERFVGDAHRQAAVFRYEVGSHVACLVQNYRGGFNHEIEEFPCHGRHVAKVTLHPCVGIHEAYHRLGVIPSFDGVYPRDSLGVGGVTADTPHRIGRVEDDPSPSHAFHGFLDVFLFVHDGDAVSYSLMSRVPLRKSRTSILFLPLS